MPTVPIDNWGDAIMLSLSNALNTFLSAIPVVIGALIILAIAWILSGILGRLVTELARRAGLDRLVLEHGTGVYGDAATKVKPSRVAGDVIKWIIRLFGLISAANLLGLTQVSQLLNQIILWIPNLIVAAIILLVAPLIARFVRGVIEVGAGRMGFSNASLLGRMAEIAIVVFAVIIAINQVGIAANLVNTLFIGVVAAIALAFGLAFGLGGRDVAAEMTRGWYDSSRQAANRVAAQAGQPATGAQPVRAQPPQPPDSVQGPLPRGARPR
jgi:hypothetical protein